MHRPAALFLGLLAASYAHVVRRTDQCASIQGSSCTNLFIGQKDTGKQVCSKVSGDNLVVEYPAVAGYPYSEVHVYLGLTPPQSQAPGQFPYTSGNGYCAVASDGSMATCKIPFAELGGCGGSYYIATHSAQGTETGWGQGPCIKPSCHPWAMYWGPLKLTCAPCSTTETPATTKPTPSPPTVKPPPTPATPSTTTRPSPTPSFPACWTNCWSKHGVSSPEAACGSTPCSDCVKKSCNKDDGAKYASWLGQACASAPTPAQCESTTVPPPVITSSQCPKKTSSVSKTTYAETSYTTTVLTNVYIRTSNVVETYTVTSTCRATVTPTPITYTTTCVASPSSPR